MKFKGKNVTLGNYKEVFEGYSLDVQDEVRSAVLDNTPIFSYVDRHKNDPGTLHEIRLAMFECLPDIYYTLSGDVLHEVRSLVRDGVNLELFEPYLGSNLSDEVLLLILSWIRDGVDVSQYDMKLIPVDMVGVLRRLVAQGYDVLPFLTGLVYSSRYIMACLTLKKQGNNVDKFVNTVFDELVVDFLALANNPWLVSIATEESSIESLQILNELHGENFPELDRVSAQDSEGRFIFMPFQLERILESYEQRLTYGNMLDPTLGIAELNTIMVENRLANQGRLKGSFGSKKFRQRRNLLNRAGEGDTPEQGGNSTNVGD